MKQICIIAVLVMAFMTGCKSDRKTSQEEMKRMFQIENVDENTGLQKMQVSRVNQEFLCGGKKYRFSVERMPSDELPRVKSDMGLFADNVIKVKIARENGSALFEKTFTKKDFEAHLSEKFLKRSVLEGLVFDDVRTEENKEITLAASVSYPMTDLYVPFTLVVSKDGKLSISMDEDMGAVPFMEGEKE